MSDRFTRLYALDNDLYISGAPVIISAGALLKDSVSGSVVAQLKLLTLSEKKIVAAKVGLCAYDVTGKALQSVDEYQYLDLNARAGDYWGADKAIVMPDPVTRAFSIARLEIVFSDGSVWKPESCTGFESVPTAKTLDDEFSDPRLKAEYRIAVNGRAEFVPALYGDIWRCSCGAFNQGKRCHDCGASKETVSSAFDIDALSSKARERAQEEQRQAEAERAKAAELEKQRKQKMKRIKVAAAVGIPAVAVVLLYALYIGPKVIMPSVNYNGAGKLLEAGEYDKALTQFEKLEGYKDSVNQIQAAQYGKAKALADEGKTTEAIQLFASLGDYKDSADRVKELKYNDAIDLVGKGQYSEAVKVFTALGDYKDAATQIKDVKYLIADQKAEAGDPGAAISLFLELEGYKDSDARVQSLQNDVISDFKGTVEAGNYNDAHVFLTRMESVLTPQMVEEVASFTESQYSALIASGHTEDATILCETFQLAPEKAYIEAESLIQSGEYDRAYKLLSENKEYKNTEAVMVALENVISGVYLCEYNNYMHVWTSISMSTGEYTYKASRWVYDGGSFKFHQGNLSQTTDSVVTGDLVFCFNSDYSRWTVSADQSKIVSEEIYTYGTPDALSSRVKETLTWVRLDDEAAKNALRIARHLGIA